uniref:protein-tyrosine-phosphatase n=1 Tax=Magallana gigas TaxID=29159 RepID=A0A8W8NUY8_MAGGI
MDYHLIFVTILNYALIKESFQYENLSLNKTVTVSQRYNNKDFDPSLAVDGDHSTDLLKCSLTASGQKEAWLTVDLGEERNIASISFIHGGLGVNAKPIDYSTSGIYRRGTTTTVETYSGWLCRNHFTNYDAQVVCLIWGFLPDNGNIDRIGSAFFGSFSSKNYECVGNETSIYDCPNNEKQCTAPSATFRPRTELRCKQGDTLSGFSVHVSNTTDWRSGTLCYQHDIEQPLNNTVAIDCVTSGRYVTIYNSRNNTDTYPVSEFAYINICELNITGCNIGFYGENCTECPDNCLNDTCQFQIGHCFGCKDGFQGGMCNEECPSGSYGRTCYRQCGNCLNQGSCDHISGVCHGGCLSGWTGDRCDQECASTLYGPFCNTSCSEYCQNKICNQSSGHCVACIGARSGLFCENEIIPESEGLGSSVAAEDIPFTIIGAVVGVFVIVLLALLVVCLLVRRKRRLDTKSEDAIGLEPMETPMSERKTNVYYDDTDEEYPMSYHNVSYITNAEEQRDSELEDTESEIETKSGGSMADLNDVELISENLGDISIKDLHDYILRKHELMDEGFKAEFKALPEGDITRCSVGSQDKNILKNRFKNTLPYDHTRVILRDSNGEDYINASYISDASGKQEYIACQGPKPTTVKDFWRMIWQENIHTIVMLTGIIEGKKRKCEQYWPSLGRTLIYGKISVTSLEEKNYAFYTIRRLKITNDQDNNKEIRYQNHFHFTGWPDHGIPSTLQLLSFYFRVKDQIKNDGDSSPLVVHCSAGVGRTGTFIAIDALVQYGLEKGTVNVTKYVSAMRRDRMHMIQTSGQYITVYKCLDEFFNYPRHVICRDIINEQIGSTLTEEFQEVCRYINEQRKLNDWDAQPGETENKDRLIIAEFPSLLLEEGFLLSRHPSTKNLPQFLSLLVDVSPSVVVVLDSEQSTTDEWIPEGRTLVVGRYVVKQTKSRVTSVNKRMSTIGVAIQHGDDVEVDIRLIEPVAQKDSDYSNVTPLSDIIDSFTSLTVSKDKPVIILNNENSVEVLVTTIVLNALHQLWLDGETDISLMSRYLLTLQPSEAMSVDDYKKCYRLVHRFATRNFLAELNLQEEHVYAN